MTLTCREVEAQMTPFIDGELSASAAAPVAAHVERCPACRRLLATEQLGRTAVAARAGRLCESAPSSLRASVRRSAPAPRRSMGALWIAASAAATVAVAIGLVALAGVVRPVPVFAAQATLDHLKCIRIGPSASSSDATAIETAWKAWQGWSVVVPSGQRGAGLKLVGYRRCVITEGRMAHLLYERGGELMSLFVIPDGPALDHAELEIFGQDAVLWTSHGLTYALVGRGGRGALAAVAASLEQEVTARFAGTTPASSGF